jgi:DNA replication protein DnaC
MKVLGTFDPQAQPSINWRLVQELLQGEHPDRRGNALRVGNGGTGKAHLAPVLQREIVL